MGTKEKLTKPTTRREPKAATLYGHLRGYISSHDIGEDASIGVVMQQLRDSIVEDSQTE